MKHVGISGSEKSSNFIINLTDCMAGTKTTSLRPCLERSRCSTSKVEGKRNPKAALPDPYTASHLKEGFSSIEFSFPNLEGKQVSLSDPIYKGKVVIVTILGSWCPNCLDENAFLSGWYKANHERGVEIIGLGFERKDDFESAKKSLLNLKNRLGIPYEILFAGKLSTGQLRKHFLL